MLFLFVPFLLKFKFGKSFEPFPAVLMPVGAHKLKQQANRIDIKYTMLYGLRQNGAWEKVNPQIFMNPIPLQYFPSLLARNFGFEADTLDETKSARALKNGFGKFHAFDANHLKSRRAALQSWLSEKLAAQGFATSALKAVTTLETVSLLTKTTIAKKEIRERIFPLDQ